MKNGLLTELKTVITLSLSLSFLFLVSTVEPFDASRKSNSIDTPQYPQDASIYTPSYSFQNDYQHRSPRSRFSSSSSSAATAAATENHRPPPFRDHLMSDSSNNDGIFDYFYSDHRLAHRCGGRVLLNGTKGVVTDGAGQYERNIQCTWLIDASNQARSPLNNHTATIRIRLHQFNTECNYDHMYIFDGDSLYSPLLASITGDMKDFSRAYTTNGQISTSTPSSTTPSSNYLSSYKHDSSPDFFEMVARSGKAFIYFHSDTAETRPGFHITFAVDSCPLDCSNNGVCDSTSLRCKCNSGFHGEGCQYVSCPNKCTSPINGVCDNLKSVCICNRGYHGEDCSLELEHQIWTSFDVGSNQSTFAFPRAFHQAVVIDKTMWVFGGKDNSFSSTKSRIFKKQKSSIIYSFNIETRQWSDVVIEGTTGVDHLADVSGHSAVALDSKVFIYGGLALNNTILDKLTVFDTKTGSLSNLSTDKKSKSSDKLAAPLAVNAHSANIVDGYMYIFFGYNPLYGNLNLVQKFNIADNSWSMVKSKGSSVRGTVGHTSTYDVVSRLIFVLGGNSFPAGRNAELNSFDPYTETWTHLHSETPPRLYHGAIVVDRQLVVLGGNSYIMPNENRFEINYDKCYPVSMYIYDLTCVTRSIYTSLPPDHFTSASSSVPLNSTLQSTTTAMAMTNELECGSRKCWHSIEDENFNLLKRSGFGLVRTGSGDLLLYGGFNGLYLNDLLTLNIGSCSDYLWQSKCLSPKIGLKCYWNPSESKCEDQSMLSNSNSTAPLLAPQNIARSTECSEEDRRELEKFCHNLDTCSDCLNTNVGCVWCGLSSSCHHGKCKAFISKPTTDSKLCYKEETTRKTYFGSSFEDVVMKGEDVFWESECRRLTNCYSCQSKPQCYWSYDVCTFNYQAQLSSSSSSSSMAPVSFPSPPDDDLMKLFGDSYPSVEPRPAIQVAHNSAHNSTSVGRQSQPLEPHSILSALTSPATTVRSPQSNSYRACETPCYLRSNCSECTSSKCVWCSTTEQCIYSPAYSAYYSLGQCMHYIAHSSRCHIASCDMLSSCDECLTNPRCGWLNDVSNTGKGKCMEGVAGGPSWMQDATANSSTSSSSSLLLYSGIALAQWHYHTCPACQCNGHSHCKSTNTNHCSQPCQNNTEGPHCDRCISGYYGKPINGGHCRPCQCNGHAEACNRESGKCYCSTKGIIGDNCNMCDEQNHYFGNPISSHNETCHYNLSTDYHYIFNMSKPDDHFYSDINLINLPLRKDSDVDFTIVCSRFALVNISSGTSYRNRKPIHTALECGSFRLRFAHERHVLSEANYSFFVRVYDFQTPFVLQIAFSQHRTLYLPQFFFTFSSCFLFFCGLSAIVWKLKHEYDLYNRRQRQFIEMEQMASRPFSSIPLELSSKSSHTVSEQKGFQTEPTPISYQPCFGSNIGVLSFFVQLPGKPNLAIGSALVNLNDETNLSSDLAGNNNSTTTNRRPEKDATNLKE